MLLDLLLQKQGCQHIGQYICVHVHLRGAKIISVLCGRVQNPNLSDWNKLLQLLQYLQSTGFYKQVINTKSGLNIIQWYVDASFVVHPDFKSHASAVMMLEELEGAIQAISREQKLNT